MHSSENVKFSNTDVLIRSLDSSKVITRFKTSVKKSNSLVGSKRAQSPDPKPTPTYKLQKNDTKVTQVI